MDRIIFVLLGLYVLSVIAYLIFEIVKVNYSPLSTSEKLKTSYPSTHVFIFFTFAISGVIALFNFIKDKGPLKIALLVIASLLAVLMVVFRLMSGHHYLTDVVGSILLATTLVTLFTSALEVFDKKEEK